MTPADIEKLLITVEQTIDKKIDTKVNGKIDRLTERVESHNISHEADMVQVRQHITAVTPILIEYNERKATFSFFKRYGDGIKWVRDVIAAVAVLWAIAWAFFFK